MDMTECWRPVRALICLSLVSLVGCRSAPLQTSTVTVRFVPPRVELPERYATAAPIEVEVDLVNEGRSSAALSYQGLEETGGAALPFTVEGLPESLPPGAVKVRLRFAPKVEGRVERTLVATGSAGERAQLEIVAVAKEPPRCEPSGTCRAARFDVDLEACVETDLEDGVTCDPGSKCVVGARCNGGRCVGPARTCDDGNACTVDVCYALTGCEFLPAPPCPGDGRCQVGVCNPQTGCGLEPAPDGTTCGPLQTCRAAEVCIAGDCVVRDPPEGYLCAEASPCAPEGRCVNDTCVRAAEPTPLRASWTYDSAALSALDAGNKAQHDFVLEETGELSLGSFFQSDLLFRANSSSPVKAPQGSGRRCVLWNGRGVCADYPASPNGRVTEVDLATGRTLWSYDVRSQTEFSRVSETVFMARLVVQSSDRIAALFEGYPKSAGTSATNCRVYFLVVLNAQGGLVRAQQVVDPLLDQCSHPHPYGVVADSVGNLYIAFSPTISQRAPLKPDKPTLFMSYSPDGVFRWKRTDPSIFGGELAVARGLLYAENSGLALLATSGVPAFALSAPFGRVVVSESRFVPAPLEGATQLEGFEAGQGTRRWQHQLPLGRYFWTDQIRLASWRTSRGSQTVALTFTDGMGGPALYGVNPVDGSEAFSCPLADHFGSAPQLFEVANGSLGIMEDARDPTGALACGKCDPPFAGSSATFHSLPTPLLGPSRAPWVGTFGGAGHDHREELPLPSGATAQ